MVLDCNFYLRTAKAVHNTKVVVTLWLLLPAVTVGFASYFWFHRNANGGDDYDGGRRRNRRGKSTKTVAKRIKNGIPPGLVNHGNTCFINCVLQALGSLKFFASWLEDLGDHKNQILLSSLGYILQVLNNKKDIERDLFSASDIIDCLSAHGWMGIAHQQDAHELFQVLMSVLDDELKLTENEKAGLPLEVKEYQTILQTGDSKSVTCIAGRACLDIPAMPLRVDSPFKGVLANRMTCLTCGYQSVGFDPFESISLRIPRFTPLSGASLDSCFVEFTKSEHVDEVYCPGCQSKQNSTRPIKSSFSKQLSFAKLPKCLCIHIQRSYLLPNGYSYKNTQFVRYSDMIDLRPYRYNTVAYRSKLKEKSVLPFKSEPAMILPLRGGCNNISLDESKKQFASSKSFYRLNAVIVHIGEVMNGHFVTYRRALNKTDNWVYASDECTKPVSKTSVLSSSAYLLFYEKLCDEGQ